jgi:hypothetical protein
MICIYIIDLFIAENREKIRKCYSMSRLLFSLRTFEELVSVRGILGILLYLSLDNNKSVFRTEEFWESVTNVLEKEGMFIVKHIMTF